MGKLRDLLSKMIHRPRKQVVGWTWQDTLMTMANPAYAVYRAAGGQGVADMIDPSSTPQSQATTAAPDYTQSWRYQQAQADLARAQAAQQAAQTRTPYTPIQVTVPSFALPTTVSGELCGFSKGAMMDKYTVMGALKKASSMRNAKRGAVPVRRASGSALRGKSPHKLALKNAGDSVKIALAAGNHAVARANQYNPAKHKPLVDLKQAVVGGVLGLAPTKPLTPAQKAAVQKHVNAIAKHARAAVWAKHQGARAIDAAHSLDATKKKAGPKIAKLLANPKTRILGIVGAHILGLDIDAEPTVAETPDEAPVLGIYDEILGAVHSPHAYGRHKHHHHPSIEAYRHANQHASFLGVDANGLSPGQPGYDPTTDPDAQGGATGGVTSNYDPSTDPNVTALGPIPPTRGQPLSQSDAQVVWRKVPDDGVVYQGDKGFPDQSIGSWNHFYGPAGATDGYEWHASDNSWWVHKGGDFDHSSPTPPNFGSDLGWGPLIGNPNGDLAGLQWATDDQKWFWQAVNAPTWATTDQDNALLELAQKIQATDQAAADADAARLAQEQAQQQEAQAAQDAANALAQSAADTQSQIAQQKQAAQQADLDVQQQQAEQQQAAQAAQQEAQAQAQYLEAQQVQIDYAKQHPEEFFGPGAPDAGGGGDAGGGDAGGGFVGPDYGDTGGGGPSGEGGAAFGPSPDDPFADVPYMWEGDGSNE